jgi:hypothetical protein
LFEKIAETGAAEVEFVSGGAPACSAPAGMGERLLVLPVRTQLVVFPAFFGITEHFVGLVDFLEFFLGSLLVLRHIRWAGLRSCRAFGGEDRSVSRSEFVAMPPNMTKSAPKGPPNRSLGIF